MVRLTSHCRVLITQTKCKSSQGRNSYKFVTTQLAIEPERGNATFLPIDVPTSLTMSIPSSCAQAVITRKDTSPGERFGEAAWAPDKVIGGGPETASRTLRS